MKKNEGKLLSSIAINKIGNVMYDYGNSTWIAALGSVGQKYLGYYQFAENIISLLLNPIGGYGFYRRNDVCTSCPNRK